jgi:hypothetical protein
MDYKITLGRRGVLAGTALWLLLVAPPYVAAQVGTWTLNGRGQVIVTCHGLVRHQGFRLRDARLIIGADGTYRQPGEFFCGPEGLEYAEIGTWEETAPGRFLLEPTNAQELVDSAIGAFVGDELDITIVLSDYRHRVRLARSGTGLYGKTIIRGRIEVEGRTCQFRGGLRFFGRPAPDNAAEPETPRSLAILPLHASVPLAVSRTRARYPSPPATTTMQPYANASPRRP